MYHSGILPAPRRVRVAGLALALAASAMPLRAQTASDSAAAPLGDSAPAAAAPAAAARLTAELVQPIRARLIGPANTSGRVTAIAANGDGKTMYVAFASGGVWKTTNHGITWRPLTDDIAFSSIGDVAVAPSDDRVVWVGTGERNSLRSNGWGDGVYKSVDGGRKWTKVLGGFHHTGRIAIHPENPDVVYVASMGNLWAPSPENGVFKTTDGGRTWEKVLFVSDTVAFVDLKMDPSDPDVLYAAGWHRLRRGGPTMEGAGDASGIWKTTNGGRSWKELTDPALDNGLPSEKLGRIGLGVHPKDPEVVYAVIQAATGSTDAGLSLHGGVFRSDDAGKSWRRTNDLSAVPDYYYNEVWLDPSDVDHLWLAGTFLAESKDGGESFQNMSLGRVHVDHHAMWVDPADPDHLVLGNDGGVHVSWDRGESWEHLQHPVTQAYQVSIDSTRTPYHVCVGLQDNGTWCGPTATRERAGITAADWYAVYGGDGFSSAVSPDSSIYRYAESQYGGLGRTNVETAEIVRLQPHAEDAGAEGGFPFRFDWDAPLLLSRWDPKTVYFGGNHLFRLNDRGRRGWTILGPDMTRGNRAAPEPDTGYTSYRALHSIAESPLDRDMLWTGSDDGLVWLSTDQGRSWREVSGSVPDAAARRCWVAEIEPSRFERETAYLVYDCHNRGDFRPYVFRTTDLGRSWTAITGDLPVDGGSYVIREDPVNPRMLYVGTEQGLFVSNRGGDRWLRYEGIPYVAVRDMDVFDRENDLVVATFGRSVYVLDLGVLQGLSEEVLAGPAHLFPVEDARRFDYRNTYESYGDKFFTGANPPSDARIAYYLRDDLGKDATLTIRRVEDDGEPEQGTLVQTITGSGRPGLHVLSWDLRSRQPRPRELGGPTRPDELREVPSGTYVVTLTAGSFKATRTFEVHEGWPEPSYGRVR